ncbi:hypothetical protein [Flavobacterium hiemivividum]|uniref:Uncharacterized protein n=1 Tax=Flavobacterium hiemivividum TaxID=2541734 RepID=A0A4R5CUY1_9FLAO|nr:hypothetical protein [Flavobacterium hiemivividum]TDE03240.1 hypothetical protein E0F98_11650 [Flavobacterium hiemivividum]
MKSITIGKLTFSKKAISLTATLFFSFGVLLGAFITLSIESESKFNFLLFLLLNIPIWAYLMPKIRKEITEND